MLEIKLDAERLDHGLNTLLKNATDTRAMMRGIASELLSMTEENFESESWGGQRWKQSRRAADKGGKTLQKSGQLVAADLCSQTGGKFPAKKRATCRQSDHTGRQQLCPHRQQQKIRRHPPPRRSSRPRPQNQPPSTPLSPHQRQQPTPTRCRTQNPRHRHRRPQKRTLTIKKRTIKCRPFLVALFATPFHFFHPAPSPIIPHHPTSSHLSHHSYIFISLGFTMRQPA